jgi:hypothetical protein
VPLPRSNISISPRSRASITVLLAIELDGVDFVPFPQLPQDGLGIAKVLYAQTLSDQVDLVFHACDALKLKRFKVEPQTKQMKRNECP